MALHNALDSLGSAASPILFLGGHSASSFAGASPESAMAMAGISSWMSVASSLRDGGVEEVQTLIGQLNDYLNGRSFLVASSGPTLADFDLYLAIVGKAGDALEGMVGGFANTRRWLEQCDASLGDLVVVAEKNAVISKLPVPVVPDGLQRKARPLPVFFFGEENEASAPAASSSVAAASSSETKGKTKDNKAASDAGGELTDEQKKAAAEKRANKKEKKAASKPKPDTEPAPSDDITISALDIRVGKILKAWEHESAEKLYCEEIDVGEDKPRQIASGLRPFYKLDEMQNRTVLVLCNLKARSLVGFPSHGMVICASNADHTKVEFAVPPEGAKIGERVMFEGCEGEPEAENKVAKKKMFEKLAPDLKTDESGVVVWKGKKSVTSAGACKAVNGMANAQVA
jgi:aminoacyl tRNA synthase complex-interacting multifunctional protein 1